MGSANSLSYFREGKVHFFCPLCHFHQSTNTTAKVTWKHHAQIAILTATITYLAWPLFGAKAVTFYLVFWSVFEFFYRARKRSAMICQSCGFDPFLYKSDVKKARTALRKHWEERIESENLFVGKKLKNYQTKPLQKTEDSESLT